MCAVSWILPLAAGANQVGRLHCIAADVALIRGFDAMEGTPVIKADGKTYTLGKTITRVSYTLTPTEELQVAPLVDELTPGAIEYVDLWLVGPGKVGHSDDRVMTKDAQTFITLYQNCLTTYGPDMIP